jgi:hypothetical protein
MPSYQTETERPEFKAEPRNVNQVMQVSTVISNSVPEPKTLSINWMRKLFLSGGSKRGCPIRYRLAWVD